MLHRLPASRRGNKERQGTEEWFIVTVDLGCCPGVGFAKRSQRRLGGPGAFANVELRRTNLPRMNMLVLPKPIRAFKLGRILARFRDLTVRQRTRGRRKCI